MEFIETALNLILEGTESEIVIPCKDQKHRNVLRTTTFRMRERMSKQGVLNARNVSITNEELNGLPCIRLSLQHDIPLLVKDEDGNWVDLEQSPASNPEAIRAFELLLKDGSEAETVVEVMADYDWERNYTLSRLQTASLPNQECAIPQDMEKRDKLDRDAI